MVKNTGFGFLFFFLCLHEGLDVAKDFKGQVCKLSTLKLKESKIISHHP